MSENVDCHEGASSEKSLEKISTSDLLAALQERLLAGKADPAIVSQLRGLVTTLEEKAKAPNAPQVEKGGPAEASAQLAEAETESSAESEGKKWADILRKEGRGILRGKFRKSWTFINPQGEEERVSDEEGPFTGGGRFGGDDMPYVGKPEIQEVDKIFLPQVDRYNFDWYHSKGEFFSSLIVVDADETKKGFKKEFEGWEVFDYSSYLANAPDARGAVIKLRFGFSLPRQRASDFVSRIEENPDFMEEVFQNTYPGLTGKGKAERVIVKQMRLVNKSSLQTKNTSIDLSFSSSVGETPSI